MYYFSTVFNPETPFTRAGQAFVEAGQPGRENRQERTVNNVAYGNQIRRQNKCMNWSKF